MFIKVICVVLFVCLASETFGKPTIYKRNEDNIYEPVMVPVSSTVIPLPVYKVGYGFGFASDKKFKPDDKVKLITVKNIEEHKVVKKL
ncbi:uncharacterized protein LOC122499244 [Leptopilina heterotoma]|uniref:uncharacterized protein LOC122499244 n=1 Tax=Leptopilina heterotoma TaxID=63436 RepID=UPI001CA95AC5|nr:uncharacterized protein LOC122499244 [Leptopilina heterotoma]